MNYLLTFLEGFASFISPCILPLVPLYISYFSGSETNNTKKVFFNSLFFVLGFSFIFIILAIFASTFGIFITKNIKIIRVVFGIICILLGFIYMDLIKLKIKSKSLNLNFNVKELNIFRSFIFGMLFSVSHTPCTGAFLGAALMLIIKQQNIIQGVILMSVYSIGIGLPFIISALLIERLKNVFNFIKKNYKIVKIASGILLIITGIYFIIF